MRSLLVIALVIGAGCDDSPVDTGSGRSAVTSANIEKVPARAARSESDQHPLYDVLRGGRITARSVREAVEFPGGLLVVDADGVLWRRSETSARRLIDRVAGVPALLPDGSVVVSRLGDEPGDSDLWVVPVSGEPRVLAPAAGPDDMPVALPDGRIAFVSGRTTVASVWLLDVGRGEATQLTNRGLRAGKNMEGFVPTPAEKMAVDGSSLVYESAPGTWWSVDLSTGRAAEVAR